MASSTAVLLSAHGTVSDVSEIPAFLTRIRRGRPTPPAIVDEVTRRFQAIGGSPLLKITRKQAAGLSERLRLPVFVGMRLASPTFDDALDEIANAGIDRVLSLPLAAQSVDVYHDALREAVAAREKAGKKAPELIFSPPWGLDSMALDAFAETVRQGIAKVASGGRANAAVVVSAHSLPLRIIQAGDAYESQFRALAAQVIARSQKLDEAPRTYRVAFQSQGMDGGEWLGPDLIATFDELVKSGAKDVVVAPIGFVADHVETLYDLDIEAVALAQERGLTMVRAPAANASPIFLDALAMVARRGLVTSAA